MSTESDCIHHIIPPTQHIMHAAKDMAALAKFTGRSVIAEFNSWVLVAEPGDTAAQIISEWSGEQRLSYFGTQEVGKPDATF